jgi:tetratricopeptide (TPR) repeat protein
MNREYNLELGETRKQAMRIIVTIALIAVTAVIAFPQSGTEDVDQAITDYTQALRLDPNYAEAYNNRGVAYKGKGEYDNRKKIQNYAEMPFILKNKRIGVEATVNGKKGEFVFDTGSTESIGANYL